MNHVLLNLTPPSKAGPSAGSKMTDAAAPFFRATLDERVRAAAATTEPAAPVTANVVEPTALQTKIEKMLQAGASQSDVVTALANDLSSAVTHVSEPADSDARGKLQTVFATALAPPGEENLATGSFAERARTLAQRYERVANIALAIAGQPTGQQKRISGNILDAHRAKEIPAQATSSAKTATAQLPAGASQAMLPAGAAQTQLPDDAAQTQLLANASQTQPLADASQPLLPADATQPKLLAGAAQTKLAAGAAEPPILAAANVIKLPAGASQAQDHAGAVSLQSLTGAARAQLLARAPKLQHSNGVSPAQDAADTAEAQVVGGAAGAQNPGAPQPAVTSIASNAMVPNPLAPATFSGGQAFAHTATSNALGSGHVASQPNAAPPRVEHENRIVAPAALPSANVSVPLPAVVTTRTDSAALAHLSDNASGAAAILPATSTTENAPAWAPVPATILSPVVLSANGDGRRVKFAASAALATGGDTLLGRTLVRAAGAALARQTAATSAPAPQTGSSAPAAPVAAASAAGTAASAAHGTLEAFVRNFEAALGASALDGAEPVPAPGTAAPPVAVPAHVSQQAVVPSALPFAIDRAAPANASSSPAFVAPAPIDHSSIADQVLRGAFMRNVGESSEMRLRLLPDSLGDVNVKLVVSDGSVTAHVLAESSEVRDALVAAQPQLTKSLADAGLKLTSFSVDISGSGAGFSQQQNRSHDGNPARRSTSLADSNNDADDALLDAIPSFGPSVAGSSRRGDYNYLA